MAVGGRNIFVSDKMFAKDIYECGKYSLRN